MHEWLVGGAVIESAVMGKVVGRAGPESTDPGLLLVQNVRRGGIIDWTPPGGVIDEGEEVVGGLTREVVEETGLSVTAWSGPLYEITARAPGLGWNLRVEVYRALGVSGRMRTGHDPDGIVTEAAVVPVGECEGRLCDAHPWVREPLVEWMAQRWDHPRSFEYLVEGTDHRSLEITRVDRG